MTAVVALLIMTLWAGGVSAQPLPLPLPKTCEEERGELRYLVQLYASQRTQAEFALARAEARRQAAEERIKALEAELKGARK